MIAIIPFDEPNVIGFRVDGHIDDEGFDRVVTTIEAASENVQSILSQALSLIAAEVDLEKYFHRGA